MACLHLATIYVFAMRQGLWVSWRCIRSPILWQSLAAAGSSGRHVQSHFTGWPIRLSTRRWWSRWPGAAMATFKSVITVPCVSVLHIIYPSAGWKITEEHELFCLLLDYLCYKRFLKIWCYSITRCRRTSNQLCARQQMEAQKLPCHKYPAANIWPVTCYFLWMKL